jgi:plastocyanin
MHGFRPVWTFFTLLAALLLLAVAGLQAASAENAGTQSTNSLILTAQQDAYVLSTQPDRNYSSGALAVSPSAQAYVQFALPSPIFDDRSYVIERAVLRLKPSRLGDGATVDVRAGRVNGAWSENQVTWNTKPAVAATGGSAATVASLDWVEWTVTELVRAWDAGRAANHGFVLGANSGSVLFHSKESGPAPELVIFLESASQPGQLILEQSVETGAEPVRSGDLISYSVTLKQEGGAAPLQVEIYDALAAGTYLTPGVYVEEILFRTRVEYQQDANGRRQQVITARGTLDPDAEVRLVIPVRVRAECAAGNPIESISNEVIVRTPGGDPISKTVNVQITCPQATLDDIVVKLVLGVDDFQTEQSYAIQAGQCGNQIGGKLRAEITNNAAEQVILGYLLQTKYIGETEKNLNAAQLFSLVNNEVIEGPFFLRAADIRTSEIPVDLCAVLDRLSNLDGAARTIIDDDLEVEFLLHYKILSDPVARPRINPDDPKVGTQSLKVRFRPWDLGDAPDSSNHFGVVMTAYPGVQANFSTVFDPSAISPGPAHARPRHFHLGRGVSLEPDADLGPSPNIHPPTNSADGDTFDDGAAPSMWNLAHCQPATIDVRIFISPQAAAWFQQNNLRGYLNGWIDGTRDGDWGDVVGCDGGGRAFEHFIIDHAIDVVTLGAGYHSLSVPTGRVLWPADKAEQPAWVRLTLSERPSFKVGTVGSVQFGDGRGHAQPFRTGETEDYLLRPSSATGSGADMDVRMTGTWRPLPGQAVSAAGTAFTYQKIEWTVRADFGNQGNQVAENVVLTYQVPQGLRGQDAEIVLTPDLRREAISVSEDRITVNLGRVEPGQRGRLMLTFRPEIGDEVVVSYMTKADIISLSDVNPANNTASFKVEIEGVTQGAFGFRSPDMPFLVQQGSTNSRDLILEGTTLGLLLPAVQKIWIHSVMVGMGQKDALAASSLPAPGQPIEVQTDARGRWSYSLTNLPDGFYQFAVGDPATCDNRSLAGNDNEWRRSLIGAGVVCGLAVVDSGLPINPISMRFQEVSGLGLEAASTGRIWLPDTLNLITWGDVGMALFDTNPEDGSTRHSVVIHGRPGLELSLGITGFGSFETKFVEKSPGRYETSFILGDGGGFPGRAAVEAAMSLRVEGDGVETQYNGELLFEALGQVRNAATGSALPGATVTLLAPGQGGEEVIFTPWDGSSLSQPNPVTTNGAGAYELSAPAGDYQLYVTAAGYQPYRAAISTARGLVNQVISLTQTIDGDADVVVAITETGFEPALLTVKPRSVIAFANTDESGRTVSGSGWESGLLLTGERYLIRAGSVSGTIAYGDSADPTRTGVILVEEEVRAPEVIFLPAVQR